MPKTILTRNEYIYATSLLTPAKARLEDLLGLRRGKDIVLVDSNGGELWIDGSEHLILKNGVVKLGPKARFVLSAYKPTPADREAYTKWLRSVRRYQSPLLFGAEHSGASFSLNSNNVPVYFTNATDAQFEAGNILFYEPARLKMVRDYDDEQVECYISVEGNSWKRSSKGVLRYEPWTVYNKGSHKTFLRKRRNWSF